MQRDKFSPFEEVDGLLGVDGGEVGKKGKEMIGIARLPEAEAFIEAEGGDVVGVGLEIEGALKGLGGVGVAVLGGEGGAVGGPGACVAVAAGNPAFELADGLVERVGGAELSGGGEGGEAKGERGREGDSGGFT